MVGRGPTFELLVALLAVSLSVLAGSSSAPSAAEVCSTAAEKNCLEGATESQCQQQVEAIFDFADKQGGDCRKQVDDYYACSIDVINDNASCDAAEEPIEDTCGAGKLACLEGAATDE